MILGINKYNKVVKATLNDLVEHYYLQDDYWTLTFFNPHLSTDEINGLFALKNYQELKDMNKSFNSANQTNVDYKENGERHVLMSTDGHYQRIAYVETNKIIHELSQEDDLSIQQVIKQMLGINRPISNSECVSQCVDLMLDDFTFYANDQYDENYLALAQVYFAKLLNALIKTEIDTSYSVNYNQLDPSELENLINLVHKTYQGFEVLLIESYNVRKGEQEHERHTQNNYQEGRESGLRHLDTKPTNDLFRFETQQTEPVSTVGSGFQTEGIHSGTSQRIRGSLGTNISEDSTTMHRNLRRRRSEKIRKDESNVGRGNSKRIKDVSQLEQMSLFGDDEIVVITKTSHEPTMIDELLMNSDPLASIRNYFLQRYELNQEIEDGTTILSSLPQQRSYDVTIDENKLIIKWNEKGIEFLDDSHETLFVWQELFNRFVELQQTISEKTDSVSQDKHNEFEFLPSELVESIPQTIENAELNSLLVHAVFYHPVNKTKWFLTSYDKQSDTAYGLMLNTVDFKWSNFNVNALKEGNLLRDDSTSLPKTFKDLFNEFLQEYDDEIIHQAFYGQLDWLLNNHEITKISMSEFEFLEEKATDNEFNDKQVEENEKVATLPPFAETQNSTVDNRFFYSNENPQQLITPEMLNHVPVLYGQDNVKLADKMVHAVYFIPFKSNWTWYLTEYDHETGNAFGLVLGFESEWGYFNIHELEELNAQRFVLTKFPQTFRELKNTELKKQMSEFELQVCFNHELSFEEDTNPVLLDSKTPTTNEGIEDVFIENENSQSTTDSELHQLTSEQSFEWTDSNVVAIRVDSQFMVLPMDWATKIGAQLTLTEQIVKAKEYAFKLFSGSTLKDSELIKKTFFDKDNIEMFDLSEQFHEDFYYVEFSEQFSDDIPFSNKVINPNVLQELKDDDFVQSKKLGYRKTWIHHVMDGKAELLDRVDIGDSEYGKRAIFDFLDQEMQRLYPSFVKQKADSLSIEKPLNYDSQLNDGVLKNYVPILADIILITPYYEKLEDNQVAHSLRYEAIRKVFHNEPLEKIDMDALYCFNGWGGYSNQKHLVKELQELIMEHLDKKEQQAFEFSSLTSYYTPHRVAYSMLEALKDKLGVTYGKALETSMGTGRFIGLSEFLNQERGNFNLHWTGIEIDPLAFKVAKTLYPNADLHNVPFQEFNGKLESYDLIVSNIPFGEERIYDPSYDRQYLIHDYFMLKGLDYLKAGGVMAVITSSGTLDKQSNYLRKKLAQRANLLGAVRLGSNVFSSQKVKVLTDIIILQKKERIEENMTEYPNWINVVPFDSYKFDEKVSINAYFKENRSMIAGYSSIEKNRYGQHVLSVKSNHNNIINCLKQITGRYNPHFVDNDEVSVIENFDRIYNSDVSFKNFSFYEIENEIYWKENHYLYPLNTKDNATQQILDYIHLRDALTHLINVQVNDLSDEELKKGQERLLAEYNAFFKKHGRINLLKPFVTRVQVDEKVYSLSLNDDVSIQLVNSLEIFDEKKGEGFKQLADIFYMRTIGGENQPEIKTPYDSLIHSLQSFGEIRLDKMCQWLNQAEEDVIKQLHGAIFHDPIINKYVERNEYLSGEILDKIETLEQFLQENPDLVETYQYNLLQLKINLPERLTSVDIKTRLSSPLLKPQYIKDFVSEVFKFNGYWDRVSVEKFDLTGQWSISYNNTTNYISDVLGYDSKINGFVLLEKSLNQQEINIYKTVYDEATGKEKRIIDTEKTMLARSKAEEIDNLFQNWVYTNEARTREIVDLYNRRFNSFKPREYDGSYLQFPKKSNQVTLYTHQKNVIDRIIKHGNTLIAHCVGAGKTYSMIASCMESKRLGKIKKALFVVPNHLVKQTANEFYTLYPTAELLVASEIDLKKENRKRFASKIATGNFDGIIMTTSQFEKIIVSPETMDFQTGIQLETIEKMLSESTSKLSSRSLLQIKQRLLNNLNKYNQQVKDSADLSIYFEELGVDRLYIDEAHLYKNLEVPTTINVQGINRSSSLRAFNMNAKVQYMNEKTNYQGVVFATGTPVTNSMSEMYVMQQYLQPNMLEQKGLNNFNEWAGTFGQIQTQVELKPEGNGYQFKTRFNKFVNISELITHFLDVADVKHQEDIDEIKIPSMQVHSVICKPDELTEKMLVEIGLRADKIRNKKVNKNEDSMLLIVSDARKLSLDARMLVPNAPENPNGKVCQSAKNIADIYHTTEKDHLTQIVFCDWGIPDEHKFNMYDSIKSKLIDLGVNPKEIAYIHDCKNDIQKANMFKKMNEGKIRVLFGSTEKLGTGTNAQKLLKAVHHIDVPWRPSDLEQRNGRIQRQGNDNDFVDCYYYMTERSLDAYMYQTIEGKSKFIQQVLKGRLGLREIEDVDNISLGYAELKAIASNNPFLKNKVDLELKLNQLAVSKRQFEQNQHICFEQLNQLPSEIKRLEKQVELFAEEVEFRKNNPFNELEEFKIVVDGIVYNDRMEGAQAFDRVLKQSHYTTVGEIASFRGYKIESSFNLTNMSYVAYLHRNMAKIEVKLENSITGNITRLNNAIKNGFENKLEQLTAKLVSARNTYQELLSLKDNTWDKQAEYDALKAEYDDVLKQIDDFNQSNQVPIEESELMVEEIDSEKDEYEIKNEQSFSQLLN